MSTAVWMVMCSEPDDAGAGQRLGVGELGLRVAMRPGISCSARLDLLAAERGRPRPGTAARLAAEVGDAYAASKGGIAALTQTLAVEYCTDGVRVNAVAPGSVTSGITTGVEFPADLTKEEGRLVRRIMSPTGFGDPADVAAVIAMLASDDGRHVTGEIVRIDGGTHA
jgi:NAD(P)-dependent dehydrogenase (short-subunit alcohol dehydrogenase family)